MLPFIQPGPVNAYGAAPVPGAQPDRRARPVPGSAPVPEAAAVSGSASGPTPQPADSTVKRAQPNILRFWLRFVPNADPGFYILTNWPAPVTASASGLRFAINP